MLAIPYSYVHTYVVHGSFLDFAVILLPVKFSPLSFSMIPIQVMVVMFAKSRDLAL